MAVKQTTTENEEKLPISRILDFINEHEQRIIRDYSHIAKQIVELLGKQIDITHRLKLHKLSETIFRVH